MKTAMSALFYAVSGVLLYGAVMGAALAQEPIVIGMSAPLSGPAAYLGQHQRWGAELAAQEINATGGVLGRKLVLKVQDNACNPSEGVTSVTRLITVEKPSAIMGALCSSVTLAVMPLIERAHVPLVVSIATSSSITKKSGVGGNNWVFKTNPSDAGLATALATFLQKDTKIRKVAAVVENTDYGHGGVAAMKNAFSNTDVSLVSEDYFRKGTQDYSAVLTKLLHEQVDAIALYMTGTDEVNFVHQYQNSGVSAPLTGRPNFGSLGESVIASGVLDGSSSVYPYSPFVDNPQNKKFVAAFKAKFDQNPIYQSFESYEALHVIVDAIKRAGNTDPEAVREALTDTSYPSIMGGTIEFDAHHQAHNKAVILEVKHGKVVVVAERKT